MDSASAALASNHKLKRIIHTLHFDPLYLSFVCILSVLPRNALALIKRSDSIKYTRVKHPITSLFNPNTSHHPISYNPSQHPFDCTKVSCEYRHVEEGKGNEEIYSQALSGIHEASETIDHSCSKQSVHQV